MIENVLIKAKKGKAMKLTFEFTGSVQDYALAWLHLSNNAREYPNVFLKHYNSDGNYVYVVTSKAKAQNMKDYMEGLSHDGFKVELVEEMEIETITPMVDWDCTFTDEADDDVEVLTWCEMD